MAFTGTLMSLSTAATAIVTPTNGTLQDKIPTRIVNFSTTSTMYLGGPGVTAGNGYPLATGAAMSLDLVAGDTLYAAGATGTPVIGILIGRQ